MPVTALVLPGLEVHAPVWQVRHHRDPAALALADRHYSRRRPGSGQVGPPGRKLVLVTHWPYTHLALDRLDAWRCVIFRNEAGTELRSSDLIRAAMDLTARLWTQRPAERIGAWVTWIDRTKITSANPGYCFKQTGWYLDRTWTHPRLIRLRADLDKEASG